MTNTSDMMILGGNAIRELLNGSENQIIETVRDAYVAHGRGDTSLPHSTFLRFAHDPSSRIIGLPAYLGSPFKVAGMKWVASFPKNIESGLDRASAALLLNNSETGQPIALLEASSINAHRTAASAALAAKHLSSNNEPQSVLMVGCGYIGYESFNYLKSLFPSISRLVLLDLSPVRSRHFETRIRARYPDVSVVHAKQDESVSSYQEPLVVFTTSAGVPWVTDAESFGANSVVLNISLRDISPELINASYNVVDDTDHVCREKTSIHLTEELNGNRDFVDAEIHQLLAGEATFEPKDDRPIIFSPFGLGILDLAVGQWLIKRANTVGVGQVLSDFYPSPWDPQDAGDKAN